MRVEGNKNSFIFYDKSGDTVLSATPNLWDNIQIVRTYIFKHNVPNFVSFTTRHLDFETLHHCFGHVSNEVMYYTLNNIEDMGMKKICFLIQKHVCCSYILEKIY